MAAPVDRLLLLDRRVSALRTLRPDLEEPLNVQTTLIRTALEMPRVPEIEPFPLPREQVAMRVRQGVPLLHDQPVTLDVNFAAELFSRLVHELLLRGLPDAEAKLHDVARAASSGSMDPQQLFEEAFVQHPDHLAQLAVQAAADADLLTMLAGQAVAPLLRAYAEHLLPLIERIDDGTLHGAAWTSGYCPVCGGWPLLGELRGVELARWLRCAGCGSGWRTQRLVCVFCGNEDYRQLGALAVDGEQRFRVEVCDRCRGYLKVGNAFDPPPAELLALDDVASMHLDVAAIERGYQRPAGSGFRIELAVPEDEWTEMEELA